MRVTPVEAAQLSLEISHLLELHFSTASLLGRRLEQRRVMSVLAEPDSSRRCIAFAASDESLGTTGVLLVERKPWEEQFFRCETVLVTLLATASDYATRYATASKLLSHWMMDPRTPTQQYATAHVPSSDVAVIHSLERAGFHLLVPTVTLEKKLEGAAGSFRSRELDNEIDLARGEDVQALEETARTAFLYGRYWVEPELPNSVAGEMHATWVRNCCRGEQADAVLVARWQDKPVGFIALRSQSLDNFKLAVIVLIAVSDNARGRGIGHRLVQAGTSWARDQGATHMIVRTELPNTIALRLYERQSFVVASTGVYYGLWRR